MKNIFEICRATLKIELKNGNGSGSGSGFFITFERNKKEFYCIMTNEHVITPERIIDKEEINIKYDNESKSFIIKLDSKERDIQCFKKISNIDLTIIEIIEKDNIKRKYFLESYFNDNKDYEQFLEKKIKIAQFPGGKELSLSEGIISKINAKNNYEFFHNANTKGGSSGSPIFLDGEIRVLGIHRGGSKKEKQNLGCFIGPAINYMKNLKREGNFIDDNIINKEESKDKEDSDDENGKSNNNKEDSDNDDDDKDNKKDDSDKNGSSDDDDKDNKKDIKDDNSDKNDDSGNNDDLDDNQKDNMKDNSDKKDDDYDDKDNNDDSDDNKEDNSDENNENSEENNNSEKNDVSDGNNDSDKNVNSSNNETNDTYSKNDVHSNNNNNNNHINTGLNINNFFDIAKTQSYHVLHGLGNLIGIKCIACGHNTKSHSAIGFGKWKCHECKYICSTLHQ